MAEMTQPEREAILDALHYGLKRGNLGMAAQLEYDRLKDEYVPGDLGQISRLLALIYRDHRRDHRPTGSRRCTVTCSA